MTIDEKNRIIQLRRAGRSMTEIAAETGISRNTVKSFCARQGVCGSSEMTLSAEPDVKTCLFCGKPVTQTPGKREKKYCSDMCRARWWNAHLGETRRAVMVGCTCPGCGTVFYAYANRNRKYCSHACYVAARFGGGA